MKIKSEHLVNVHSAIFTQNEVIFYQKHAFGNLLAQHIAFVQMKIKLKLQIFETKLKSLKSKHVHVFLYMNIKSSLVSFVILILPTQIYTLLVGWAKFLRLTFFGD